MNALRAVVFAGLAVVALAQQAAGATYVVDWTGAGDFVTIQAAVDACSEGDVVLVAPGVYSGVGNRDINFGGTNIVVRSMDGPDDTIIDCQDAGRGFHIHSGENATTVIEGLTIQNAVGFNGGAISISGSTPCSPTITRCKFVDNGPNQYGTAMYIQGGDFEYSLPHISECYFEGNSDWTVYNTWYGRPTFTDCVFNGNPGRAVYCWSSQPVLENCTFYGNGYAVVTSGTAPNPALSNCIVAFNASGVTGTATLQCCDVYGNSNGDWVGAIAPQYGVNGNISADPLFCDPGNSDVRLSENSPCAPTHNPECGLIGAGAMGCGDEPGYTFVHITDLHVDSDGSVFYPRGDYDGVNLRHMCSHLANLDPPPDFVVITGDLVNEGDEAKSWELLHEILEDYDIPTVYALAGNHDWYDDLYSSEPLDVWNLPWMEPYRHYFSDRELMSTENLQLLSMDSGWNINANQSGWEGSGVSDDQVDWLEETAESSTAENKILLMHHPIIYQDDETDALWDHSCISQNQAAMLGACDLWMGVVLSGHTHAERAYAFPWATGPEILGRSPSGFWSTSQYRPMYFTTGSCGEERAYRRVQVLGDEVRVFNQENANVNTDIFLAHVDYTPPLIRDGDATLPETPLQGDLLRQGFWAPIELHAFDSLGNHVGMLDTGEAESGIAGAFYDFEPILDELTGGCWTTGELISLNLDSSEVYSFELRAALDCTLSLKLRTIRKDGGGETDAFYRGIPVVAGAVGRVVVDREAVDHTLYLDLNGDGIVDEEIAPTEVSSHKIPAVPQRPAGSQVTTPDVAVEYTAVTTDPENDGVVYLFDWGDGSDSGWIGPLDSGSPCTASHAWAELGLYPVRVKAKDVNDHVSDWSPALTVSVRPSTPPEETSRVTFGQGFYGNTGGEFNGASVPEILEGLLTPGDPLVIGSPLRSVTFEDGAEECIIERLPAGHGPDALPASLGCATIDATTCQTLPEIPVGKTDRYDNTLLGQTVALALNVRLDDVLPYLELCGEMRTQGALPGANGILGDDDDELDVDDPLLSVTIDPLVLQALADLGLECTVGGLVDLANRALGEADCGGASLEAINQAASSINKAFEGCRFLVYCSGRALGGPADSELDAPDVPDIPSHFALMGCSPSPVSQNARIHYALPERSAVRITVYNVSGRVVAVLEDGEIDAGHRQASWDVAAASELSSGVYFYRIEATGMESGQRFTAAGKTVLIR
ncbi:MAG: metallophosphoesterase [Candidatus Eisenbacteria bacterium]